MTIETTLTPGTNIRTTDGNTVTVASGLNQARAPRGTIAVTRGDLPVGGVVFLPVGQIRGVDEDRGASIRDAFAKGGIVANPLGDLAQKQEDEEWNAELLALAAAHERVVTFEYKRKHETATRSLVPEEVITTAAGDRLVIGYDEDRDDTRSFRIDRIVGVVSA